MAKTKKGLPELAVDSKSHPGLVTVTKEASDLRSQIASLETKEKAAKAKMAELASGIRATEETKGNYIGIVKVTDAEMSPSQIQFRMTNAAIDVEQGPTLDAHFNAARPMLWSKDMVVTGITDPNALIEEMKDRGQNPWDYLEIKVKPGLDANFRESLNVVKGEAYLPVEGFLSTVNEFKHTFSAEAKEFLKEYFQEVLKASVSLGHK
ncbi:MAG: hypothetical protein IMZ61_10010 [Planctomycetes bacterium]|nr:hypothetical protein [Planctomycetota bacterium]